MSLHGSLRATLLCATLTLSLFGDTVGMKNGDKLTGKVMQVDGKELTLKSDLMGVVKIPWDAIDSLSSAEPLNLVLKDGQQLVGNVEGSGGVFNVTTAAAGKVTTNKDSIKLIRSKEEQATYEATVDRLQNPKLLDLWTGYIDTSFAKTSGNSKTDSFNLTSNLVRATNRDKISVNFTSLYASNSTSGISLATANATRGGIAYSLNLTPRIFAFGFTNLEYDEFQRLDLRFVIGGGGGYHVIKNDRTMFDLSLGGNLNKEFFFDNIHRNSGEALFAEELSHKISKITSLTEKLVFYPNLTNGGEYRMNFDAGAITNLNKWLAWSLTFSDRYISNPVLQAKKNDTLFTTGIRINLSKQH
jgi:putative salt-induced outer membrane protein